MSSYCYNRPVGEIEEVVYLSFTSVIAERRYKNSANEYESKSIHLQYHTTQPFGGESVR
jgi:hypothetical protein